MTAFSQTRHGQKTQITHTRALVPVRNTGLSQSPVGAFDLCDRSDPRLRPRHHAIAVHRKEIQGQIGDL